MFDIEWIKKKVKNNEEFYSLHGEQERQNDNLTISEVREAILNGIILEQYPDSNRGESCLVAGFTKSAKPVHIVCGEREDKLVIITVYIPYRQNSKPLMCEVNMNTNWHFCGNKNFKDANVQYIYRHDNKFLIVNDVPCEQCEYCGEQYFEGKVLRSIEEEFMNIHTKGKQPKVELRVPVEQFAELQYV